MDYKEFEMTDLTPEEAIAIDAKRFADMILEYDSKEEETKIESMCKKWAEESKSLNDTFKKVYEFAKQFWNENELKEKIFKECFTDKELCEKITK
jgi:hypothetical protein